MIPDIDKLIEPYVLMLNKHDIKTDWSCQGHPGEAYVTGFPKPERGRIGGTLRKLEDLLTIEELITGEGCPCGTCRTFRISAGVCADAGGIMKPIRYHFSIDFHVPITEKFLIQASLRNHELTQFIEATGAVPKEKLEAAMLKFIKKQEKRIRRSGSKRSNG